MAENDIATQLDELCAAHRILAVEGHEDRTSGHVSWRDPEGRGFWMKRSQIGMDEVLTPDDLNATSDTLTAVAKIAYQYTLSLRQGLAIANLVNTAGSIAGMLPH